VVCGVERKGTPQRFLGLSRAPQQSQGVATQGVQFCTDRPAYDLTFQQFQCQWHALQLHECGGDAGHAVGVRFAAACQQTADGAVGVRPLQLARKLTEHRRDIAVLKAARAHCWDRWVGAALVAASTMRHR